MFDDASPIYLQIAHQLEDEILSGALAPDAQVMSTNQYAAFYRINPATAAKGLQQLVDDGILYKRRGLGMFVSPDAHEVLLARRREKFFDDVVAPMIAEARRIGIPIADIAAQLEREEGSWPTT
ncbi:MAG TPA: GntR family transcriptional regulator [Jiangellaceae bacterium]|nr:GntR family transcriptional regulator [Jiangellaceae bacterium]